MKKDPQSVLLFLLLLASNCQLEAQEEALLTNPSFEDIPRAGGTGYPMPIRGWFDLGQFPKETPPDIHGINTGYWKVTTFPHDGNTFLGLVTRPDGSYEGVYTNPIGRLVQGERYRLNVFLCHDTGYESAIKETHNLPQAEQRMIKFDTPIILRIWGSWNGEYDELFFESKPINHTDWRRYVVDLLPSNTYRVLIIEAYHPTGQENPVAGNLLIDNMQLVKVE
jgi:hypothetical protein